MRPIRTADRRRRGFTVLEILVVVAIIGLLSSILIVNYQKLFTGAQESTVELFVNDTSKAALMAYAINMGSYPSTADGLQALLTAPASRSERWRGPYIETKGNKVPVDPWGNPYQYRFPGVKNTGRYDLWSLGPDGVESADDIGNW